MRLCAMTPISSLGGSWSRSVGCDAGRQEPLEYGGGDSAEVDAVDMCAPDVSDVRSVQTYEAAGETRFCQQEQEPRLIQAVNRVFERRGSAESRSDALKRIPSDRSIGDSFRRKYSAGGNETGGGNAVSESGASAGSACKTSIKMSSDDCVGELLRKGCRSGGNETGDARSCRPSSPGHRWA